MVTWELIISFWNNINDAIAELMGLNDNDIEKNQNPETK